MPPDNKLFAPDMLTSNGGAIKSLGNGEYEICMYKFTSPQRPDLTDEFFSDNTEFIESLYPFTTKLLYHHALNDEINVIPVGDIKSAQKRSGDGVYGTFKIELANNYRTYIKTLNNPQEWKAQQEALADEYEDMFREMVDSGRYRGSGGALPGGVVVDETGEIKRWNQIEYSLTPQPAEPVFTKVTPLKSLTPLSLRGLLTTDREVETPIVTTSDKQIDTTSSKGITTMDPLEQLKELISQVIAPLIAVLTAGGGDVQPDDAMAAIEDEAMGDMGKDPAMAKSVTREMVETWSNEHTPQIIAALAQKSYQTQYNAVEMVKGALALGRQNALAAQEGKSKVKAFSKDSDANVRKNFNINLGAPEPTFLSTVKAMMPGATDHEKRQSGIASVSNEYTDAIKAQNPYIGPLGGFTVVQELRDQILDPLRPEVIAFGLGVQQTSANGAGAVVLPKMTTAPSAFRPGINTTITGSQAKFDTITAFLRPIAAEVIIPLQMLQTGLPQAEAKIKEQMIKSIALQIDKEIFIGTGDVVSPDTGAGIRGILSLAKNVVSLNDAGRRPGYQDLVDAVTQLSIENVPEDNTNGWAMHPRTRGTFWGMKDNVAQPLWRADVSKLPYPEMVGYRAAVSTQIPVDVATTDESRTDSSYIFYGRYNMAEYIMAQDLAIFVNPYIYSNQLQVQLLAYTFSDFIVHYPAAFYVMKNVTA